MKEETLTTSNIVLDGKEVTYSYATIKTPNYVGGYRLGTDMSVQFNLTYKPNWFHRNMMKLCFGWEWVNL
jgi:hypothetical protein